MARRLRNFMDYEAHLRLSPRSGVDIGETLREAIDLAKEIDVIVTFEFSEVEIRVDGHSDVESLKRLFFKHLRSQNGKRVGP